MNKVPDNELAEAIRKLQNEIDEKYVILKALREQYNSEDIDYYEYLKTATWQEQRQKIFRRDGFKCVLCGAAKNLEVHHITYKNLGVELESDLVTVCDECHENVHDGIINRKNHIDSIIYAIACAICLGDDYESLEYKLTDDDFPMSLQVSLGTDIKDYFLLKHLAFDISSSNLLEVIRDCSRNFSNKDISKDAYYMFLYKSRSERYEQEIDRYLNLLSTTQDEAEKEEYREIISHKTMELDNLKRLIGEGV